MNKEVDWVSLIRERISFLKHELRLENARPEKLREMKEELEDLKLELK